MKLSEQCIAVEQSQKLADLGVAQIISTWEGTRTSYSSYAVHVSNDAVYWDTYSRSELDMLVEQGVTKKYQLAAFTGTEITDIIMGLVLDNMNTKLSVMIANGYYGGKYKCQVQSSRLSANLGYIVEAETIPQALCKALIHYLENQKESLVLWQVNERILSWHTVDGLDKPTIIK